MGEPITPRSQPLRFVDCGETDVWFTAIGDVHWGNRECEEEHFKRAVNEIGEREAWWIGLGDYVECALTAFTPPGAVWDQTMEPTDQFFQFKELLQPIKQRCVGLIIGNHEERLRKAGFDSCRVLANDLGTHYFGPMAHFALKVGTQRYSGAAWHGAGGAVTLGAKVNQLVRGAEVTMPDMRWQGHTHEKLVVSSFYDVQKGNRIVQHKCLDIIGGHFCCNPRYMQWRPARKGAIGVVWVKLEAERFGCHATI